MEFMRNVKAHIDVGKETLVVGDDIVVNCLRHHMIEEKRSGYCLIAGEDITIPPQTQARIVATIYGLAPDFEDFYITGKRVTPGYIYYNPCKEIVVFYNTGTVEHVIKAGDTIGNAFRTDKPLDPTETKNVPTVAAVTAIAESKAKDNVDVSKIIVGDVINKKKFRMMMKHYTYALDGKDPNLKTLQELRREKEFWNSEDSRGKIFTPNDSKPIYIPQY